MNFGYATLQIIPSLRGAKKQIESQLGTVDASSSGKRIGTTISDGIGSVMKGAATATVGLAAVGIGTALTKGFQRLESLDKARSKLSGLGHDASTVEQIIGKSGDAMEAVSGTAFGLGEAATVAAGAVAAGVAPGADLQRTLGLVADAATIAGTDMGQMGAVFNKVAASNRVTLGIINQLQTAGIPALQMIADEMGVTAAEASKMVSSGEVDFATFQNAMEKSLGGAAKESGNTFSGAMKNIGAALGRVGEGFLGSVFPMMAPLFSKISAALSPIATKAAELGERIAMVLNPAIERLGQFLEQGRIPNSLQRIQKVIGPALAAFIALGASGFSPLIKLIPGLGGLSTKLTMLSSPVGLLAAAFLGLIAVSPELREALGKLMGSLGELIGNMAPRLEQLGGILTGVLVSALTLFADVLTVVVDNLSGFIDWINQSEVATNIFQGALGAALAVFVGYKLVVGTISFAKLIAGLVGSTAAWVKNTAAMVASKAQTVALMALYTKDFVVNLAKATAAVTASTARWVVNTSALVANKVAMVASRAAMLIGTTAQWLWNAALNANPLLLLGTAIAAVVAGLIWFFTQTELGQKIWGEFTRFLTEAWDNTVQAFLNIGVALASWWNDFWNGISSAVTEKWTEATTWISQTWDGLLGSFSEIGSRISGWWTDFWSGVGSAAADRWSDISTSVTSKFEDIRSGLSRKGNDLRKNWESMWSNLASSSKKIWSDTKNNAVSIFESVKNGIMTPVNFIRFSAINAFRAVRDGVRNAFQGIGGFVSSAFQTILVAVRQPLNGIIGLVNNAIDGLNSLSVTIPSWVPLVGGSTWGVNLPRLPNLAKGATVLPRPGGTLAVLGEAGRSEAVVDEGGLNALITETLAVLARLQSESVGNNGVEITQYNYNPREEPASVQTNKALQTIAALSSLGNT